MSGRVAARRVLVSHPHVAPFALHAALGLLRHDRLGQLVSGVIAPRGSVGGRVLRAAARRWPQLGNRLVDDRIAGRVRSLPGVELGARAVARMTGGRLSRYDAMFVAHDAAVAALPWPRDTDAVLAYEDAALWTFRRAAAAGIAPVWDLPLPHHETIAAIWDAECRRWPGAMAPPYEPRWKQRRKDAELALASAISVASAFTRESLERIGVRAPILVTPYGFPADDFVPKPAPPDGPFTVLAVGTHDLRKGTPYLLEAWRRAAPVGARLWLIGQMRLSDSFLAPYRGLFDHTPYLPRAHLGPAYQSADLLAFPTLGDGFGIVLQEAMCSGTPVVTTPCGGGPECVDHGENGWLIPARDIDALADVLRWAAKNRDAVHAAGRAARRTAEHRTWADAGDTLVDNLGAVVNR